MKLTTFHQVLIVAAALLALLFALRSLWSFSRAGVITDLLLGAVGVGVAGAGGYYLRAFRRKLAARQID